MKKVIKDFWMSYRVHFLWIFLSFLPGIAAVLLYKMVVSKWSFLALKLSDAGQNIGIVGATFSFTMIGFFIALIAIFISMMGTKAHIDYCKKNMSIFIFIYLTSMLHLVLTFVFSLLSLTKEAKISSYLINVSIGSIVNNLFHMFVITLIIVNICKSQIKDK